MIRKHQKRYIYATCRQNLLAHTTGIHENAIQIAKYKFMTTFSQFIFSRKNEVSVRSFSQISHVLLNFLSVQQSQIATFCFLHLSGTWHLCNLNTLDRYLQKFMSQFQFCKYETFKGYILPGLQEDLLTWKVFFLLSHMFPWMNKFLFHGKHFSPSFNNTRRLQFFALYLPRCLCLE